MYALFAILHLRETLIGRVGYGCTKRYMEISSINGFTPFRPFVGCEANLGGPRSTFLFRMSYRLLRAAVGREVTKVGGR